MVCYLRKQQFCYLRKQKTIQYNTQLLQYTRIKNGTNGNPEIYTYIDDIISARHFIILILLERYNTHKNGRVPLNIFIVGDERIHFFFNPLILCNIYKRKYVYSTIWVRCYKWTSIQDTRYLINSTYNKLYNKSFNNLAILINI